MNNKSDDQKTKKVINAGAGKNDNVNEYMVNVVEKAKKDLEKIETEIEVLEKTTN